MKVAGRKAWNGGKTLLRLPVLDWRVENYPLLKSALMLLLQVCLGSLLLSLRQIFDSIRDVRGLFFDEFDALGSHRGSK